MNDGLREQIERHYLEQRLDGATLDRLASLPGAGSQAGWNPRRWALAACIFALLMGNAYFAWHGQRERHPARPPGARFVAMRSYADHCPACKQTLPPFEQLENRFAGERVLFVSRDVGDPVGVRRGHELCAGLGVRCTDDRCCEIHLMDRASGQVLARYSSGEAPEPFESAFEDAVVGEEEASR